ncbi:MAG: alcohol dehydrogenase catalytic domain-containing protein [Defluviitaleaceae bacterium]|nr:alcohol dehydrogenase catalytic domain-containing protein [Defluviitaleaceae bacterium]
MKAAKLVELSKIIIEDAKTPAPAKPGDVLVRVKAVGICGTDLHIFKDGRPDVILPRILGHELSGVAEDIFGGTGKIASGDGVVLDPVYACQTCPVCVKGRRNVCANVKCFGVQMDGGFCEYIVANEDSLHRVPDGISFEQAALAEPYSIAANILARVTADGGDNILIMGAGTIGLSLLQAAKGLGARVLISDKSAEKLRVAKLCGADATVDATNERLAKEVEEFSPGGADVVIDAVGVSPLFKESIDLAAPAGRIAVIGFDSVPAGIAPLPITKKELTIVGSRRNNRRFPEVMDWLEKGRLKLDIMVSRTYPLDKIQEAFTDTLRNSDQIVKTIILI